MKIISKYHDYYDTIIHSKGMDPSVLYLRENKVISLKDFPQPPRFEKGKTRVFPRIIYPKGEPIPQRDLASRKQYTREEVLDCAFVGFCGELIFAVAYQDRRKMADGLSLPPHSFYFDDDAEKMAREFMKSGNYWRGDQRLQDWLDLRHQSRVRNLFVEHRVPVFLIHAPSAEMYWSPFTNSNSSSHQTELVLNPNLTQMKFFRHVDPFQAFQRIEMYISGVLGQPEKPHNKIPDVIMAESKGFDKKWSFRREKHQRKGR